MSLNARIIPNPGDGIVQAFSDLTKKTIGFVKNCVDVCCVVITLGICTAFGGHIVGIGIGTILAMVGVGRVIAAYNALFERKQI